MGDPNGEEGKVIAEPIRMGGKFYILSRGFLPGMMISALPEL